MLAQNLRTSSLSKAMERTFDGEHPCKLCKSIAIARQTEKKAEFAPELQKFEFPFTLSSFTFVPPSQFYEVGQPVEIPDCLVHSPPVPPPKQFLG